MIMRRGGSLPNRKIRREKKIFFPPQLCALCVYVKRTPHIERDLLHTNSGGYDLHLIQCPSRNHSTSESQNTHSRHSQSCFPLILVQNLASFGGLTTPAHAAKLCVFLLIKLVTLQSHLLDSPAQLLYCRCGARLELWLECAGSNPVQETAQCSFTIITILFGCVHFLYLVSFSLTCVGRVGYL